MSKQNIYENEIEEEDIEEIEEIDEEDDVEEDITEEDIDDGDDDLLKDLDELVGDLEDYEEDIDDIEEQDELLDDLDDLINDYDYEEEEPKEEQIVVKRTTFNILTKYEKNFILGFRTQQIINGSVILIDINTLKDKSAYSIAQEELRLKCMPFKIKRTLPNGKVEIWDISELIIL